jgi:NAD dependent epimerase/dehydratase family enzyme
VLTPDSLASQVAQFRRHFGAWIGTGRGWTPWIHIDDEVGIIAFALEQAAVQGPINLTAPEPARAREFAQAQGGRSDAPPGWLFPLRLSGSASASLPTFWSGESA